MKRSPTKRSPAKRPARKGATRRAERTELPEEGRARAVVEDVTPCVEGGRFPAKRTVGEDVVVEADVFADGHVVLRAEVLHRHEEEEGWNRAPMRFADNDRWRGSFPVERLGRHRYTVRAWVDPFASWRRDLEKRLAAGQDIALQLLVGAELLRDAAKNMPAGPARALGSWIRTLEDEERPVPERSEAAIDEDLLALLAESVPPHEPTLHEREYVVVVDPPLARFSAWYETFPRSASPEPGRHGTLRDVEALLSYVAGMGFDILYLPPIHPIGHTFRKGRNNSLTPEPDDPGSPWAIGSEEGGHDAVHPELGTLEDVRRLARAAREKGIELALDVAFQTSPDHPWVREHEEWFKKLPDGSIQYAENPPKKYQDIYPIEFESEDWQGLWVALRDVFLFWIDHGVTVFRVDNPHTKSLHFWEWCLGEVKARCPEAIFLSEAFTRPKLMRRLARAGFTQSYTYFPWRNDKDEIVEYLTELTGTPVREYLRPSQWANTPDILTEYLQVGGRPAFVVRLVLAATLGASYGIYGPAFELCEARPLRDGSEEYLDSEKYQIREWDRNAPHTLRPLIARMNRIRRENPALQGDWSLRFHKTDNEHLICYSKADERAGNAILVVVNLDPHHRHSGWLFLDLHALGLKNDETFQVHDLVSEDRFLWRNESNYVELDPAKMPAHVFRVRRRARTEQDFDYYI